MVDENCFTGWLSPAGEFFPCKTEEQRDKATELCTSCGIDRTAYPEEELLWNGWISIEIIPFLGHGYSVTVYPKIRPTHEQMSFLKPYYDGKRGLEMIDVSKKTYEYYMNL